MASGTRSTKRSQLLASVEPADPYSQLMLTCDRSGDHAYKLPAHGCSGAAVDLSAVTLLGNILRPRLTAAHVSLDVPDLALREIDSICGPAATSGGMREWMEKLRVWEQEQAAVTGEGDDRTRVHMYASAVSAALVSRTLDAHGVTTAGGKATFTFEEEPFVLTSASRATLSWMAALSGRYTYLGSPKSYIDPLSLARGLSERSAAADITALAMCQWRERCNEVVDEHVPAAERKFVHLALDSFAVCSGPDVTKQGGRAGYILAKSSKAGEKHAKNDTWLFAFKTALRQLKELDKMYDLKRSEPLWDEDEDSYTSLAERAERAWEGPESLGGKAFSTKTPFATTRLYFARSFPLRLLSDAVPEAFAHYTIIIWVCPRAIWTFLLATPIVFSVVDSVFCGYVPMSAKSALNHMLDDAGKRADLDQILNETRYGTAFYHSDSQPQRNVEAGDDESDDDQHASSSPYEMVRARSIISTEVRDQLLADRGDFRKALRKFLSEHVPARARSVGLAKW